MALQFPLRPEEDYLVELAEDGQFGEIAASTIRSAWAEIDRLKAELYRTYAKDSIDRAQLAIQALDVAFPVQGFFVYVLYDADDHVVYVGQSGSVFSRIGNHLADPEKNAVVCRAAMIACPSRAAAMRTERDMIDEHQPRFNTVGIRKAG